MYSKKCILWTARIRMFSVKMKNGCIFLQHPPSKRKIKSGSTPKNHKSLEEAGGHLIFHYEIHSDYPRESKPPVTKWKERTPGKKERHMTRKSKDVSYLFDISGVAQEAVFFKAYICYFEMNGAHKLNFFSMYWSRASYPWIHVAIKICWSQDSDLFQKYLLSSSEQGSIIDSEGKPNKTAIAFKGWTLLQIPTQQGSRGEAQGAMEIREKESQVQIGEEKASPPVSSSSEGNLCS